MKVNRINPINRVNIEINTHWNKHRTYLYNEMFSFAKEHQISGRFGNDYIDLEGVPVPLLKFLEKLQIKFKTSSK